MQERSKCVVVGAGIGGLAVAAALAEAGIEVAVLEQADALTTVGAGLTVQPNAVLALQRLGLVGDLPDVARVLDSVTICDAAGRVLSALGPDEAAALRTAVGAPAWGLHRATLQHHLLAAAMSRGVHVRTSAQVGAVDAAHATVTLVDGERISGDILIGADGLDSQVRAGVLGRHPPRYSGYTCWRGVSAEAEFTPDWAGEFWGAGRRFGGCGIDGDRWYWFAVVTTSAGGRDRLGAKSSVTRLVAGFPAKVRALVASTPEADIFRTDIYDRAPSDTWGTGPTTLLGDAAHAMTPNLGQGACQAIEDALVLRDRVVALGCTPAALREYETQRRPRANEVVARAAQFGRIAQWQAPVAVALRNTALRLTPSQVLSRQLRTGWTLPY